MVRQMRERALLILCLFTAAGASWIPRPLHEYPSYPAGDGAAPGHRRYWHEEAHSFEDGTDLALSWEVEADPDSIMSLDLEHHRGARMLECRKNRLVLQVPAELAQQAQRWRHVTASEELHGCPHLVGSNLYHRIHSVEHVAAHSPFQMSGAMGAPKALAPVAMVTLSTQELASHSQVFPYCRYSVRFVPAEAKDEEELRRPRRYPLRPGGLADGPTPASARRLGLMDMMSMGSDVDAVTDEAKSGEGGRLSLGMGAPQVTNASESWHYLINTTDNPQFKYTFPGGVGFMRFYKPFVDAKFGITINQTSQFQSLGTPPHVVIDAEIEGWANFSADVAAAVNFKTDRSYAKLPNILAGVDIPGLGNITDQTVNNLKPLKFYLGPMPLTVKPDFKCPLEAYHIGLLQGTLRFGLDTELKVDGLIRFDTDYGFQTNLSTRATNVKFTPPTWMLFTQNFELGMMFVPTFTMKGGFADNQDMELGFAFTPYYNISIHQTGSGAVAAENSIIKELIVFPFRAVGLPSGKSYVLEITVNGITKKTALQLSTGVIEYNCHVTDFDFGSIAETNLLGAPITVSVLENGVSPPVATANATCASVINGLCGPVPVAKMTVDGQAVSVHLTTAWNENALNMIKSEVKSISLRFPSISLQPQASGELNESSAAMSSALLLLRRNGREYHIPIQPRGNSTPGLMMSSVIYELGPSFLKSWDSSAGTTGDTTAQKAVQTQMELLINGVVVGVGTVPTVSWDKSVQMSSFGSSSLSFQVTQVPVYVPLYNPQDSTKLVGTGEMEVDVVPASKSAFWVSPYEAVEVPAGQPYTLSWTTHGGQEGYNYRFTLAFLKVNAQGGLTATSWVKQVLVSCTTNSSRDVGRYTAGATPCVFDYQAVPSSDLAGETVTLLASWVDNKFHAQHQMLSVPFTVTSGRRLAASKRALAASGSQKYGVTDLGSGTGISKKMQQKLAQLRASCSSKPLKYAVGAGLYFNEIMKNVVLPLGMGQPGSTMEQPDWKSDPVPIFRLGTGANHGAKLKELLPKSMCAGGVCEGMMPGCQQKKVNPINIKQVVFKTNRRYNWKEHAGPKLRHAIAYGLALLPEAIEIGEQEIETDVSEETTTAPLAPAATTAAATATTAAAAASSAQSLVRSQPVTTAAPGVVAGATVGAVAGAGAVAGGAAAGAEAAQTTVVATTPEATTVAPTPPPTTPTTLPPTRPPTTQTEPPTTLPPTTQPPTTRPTQPPTTLPTQPPVTQPPATQPPPTQPPTKPPTTAAPTAPPVYESAPTPAPPTVAAPSPAMDVGFENVVPFTPPSPSRRLHEDALPEGWEIVRPGDEPREWDENPDVQFDKFTVRITQPMNYELNEEVMHRLLRDNAFRISDGREGERGPIFIQDFELHDPLEVGSKGLELAPAPELAEKDELQGADGEAAPIEVTRSRGLVSAAVALCASIAVVGLAAAAVIGRRGRADRYGLAPSTPKSSRSAQHTHASSSWYTSLARTENPATSRECA